MATVMQSGGDYGSLAAACSAAETTISIEGTWSAADTNIVDITTANTAITTDADSKHDGRTVATSPTYYRLETNTSDHAITVTASGAAIDGLVIRQINTGSSLEAVRLNAAGTFTISDSLLVAGSTPKNQQDGIYIQQDNDTTINLDQCVFVGWGREGVFVQNYSSGLTFTQTLNVNSCVFYRNGENDGDPKNSGGIGLRLESVNFTATVNIHNCIAVNNDAGTPGNDYAAKGVHLDGAVWNISHSIDGDNSIADLIDTGTGNLASRTETDSATPGAGDWVIFNDLTGYPHVDLRLQDVPASNDAQDAHSTATAHSLTIPATDVVGTARPQNTNYDIGPYEIPVTGGDVSDAITPTAVTWAGTLSESATAHVADAITPSATTWSGTLTESATANVADSITPVPVTWAGTLTESVTANVADSVAPAPITWTGVLSESATANVSDVITPGAITWSGTLSETAAGNMSDTITPAAIVWSGSFTESATAHVADAIAATSVQWSGVLSEVVTANAADAITATSIVWSGTFSEAAGGNVSDTITPSVVLWSGILAESVSGDVSDSIVATPIVWSGTLSESATAHVADVITPIPVAWSGTSAEAVTNHASDAISPATMVWSGALSESVSGGASDAMTSTAIVWSGTFSEAVTGAVSVPCIFANRMSMTLVASRMTKMIIANREMCP